MARVWASAGLSQIASSAIVLRRGILSNREMTLTFACGLTSWMGYLPARVSVGPSQGSMYLGMAGTRGSFISANFWLKMSILPEGVAKDVKPIRSLPYHVTGCHRQTEHFMSERLHWVVSNPDWIRRLRRVPLRFIFQMLLITRLCQSVHFRAVQETEVRSKSRTRISRFSMFLLSHLALAGFACPEGVTGLTRVPEATCQPYTDQSAYNGQGFPPPPRGITETPHMPLFNGYPDGTKCCWPAALQIPRRFRAVYFLTFRAVTTEYHIPLPPLDQVSLACCSLSLISSIPM
jgi:hypothetical protein